MPLPEAPAGHLGLDFALGLLFFITDFANLPDGGVTGFACVFAFGDFGDLGGVEVLAWLASVSTFLPGKLDVDSSPSGLPGFAGLPLAGAPPDSLPLLLDSHEEISSSM